MEGTNVCTWEEKSKGQNCQSPITGVKHSGRHSEYSLEHSVLGPFWVGRSQKHAHLRGLHSLATRSTRCVQGQMCCWPRALCTDSFLRPLQPPRGTRSLKKHSEKHSEHSKSTLEGTPSTLKALWKALRALKKHSGRHTPGALWARAFWGLRYFSKANVLGGPAMHVACHDILQDSTGRAQSETATHSRSQVMQLCCCVLEWNTPWPLIVCCWALKLDQHQIWTHTSQEPSDPCGSAESMPHQCVGPRKCLIRTTPSTELRSRERSRSSEHCCGCPRWPRQCRHMTSRNWM